MINDKLKTLKLKLTLSLALVVVVILAAFAVFNYHNTEKAATSHLNALSERVIWRLSENLILPLWEVDQDWVERIVYTELNDRQIQAIIIHGDGGLLVSKVRNKEGRIVDNSHHVEGNHYIVRKKEITRDGETIGSVEVFITRRLLEESLFIKSINIVIATALLIFLIVTFLILALNRIVINPLNLLLEHIRAVASGVYTSRIEIKQHDEIGLLADGFNAMQSKIQLRKEERDQVTADLFEKTFELEKVNKKLESHQEHLEQLVEERTQESTKARNVANQANQTKSIFLANMSHELRTPLNAVLGFSELMARDKEITPKQKESLDIINRSGRHLLSMINDVLDLSKIESGGMSLNIETVDLYVLLYDIEVMMRSRAEAKGLDFQLQKGIGLEHYILIDESKLRQILINLLGNAVKYTDSGSVCMDVNAVRQNEELHLSFDIKDTGVGIAKDDLETIFNPFVQVGRSPSKQKGTGLGLAITHRLAELMGGDISVESELNKGSTFHFNIMVETSDASKLFKENEDKTSVVTVVEEGFEWRILIVDDIYDNRLLLRHYLQDAGFHVREAANGKEAIEQFESWKPQFIWMDMRMPVMDGYTAVARIRKMPGGKEVKIVALTASVLIDQRPLILGCGCDDVIYKPFRPKEIFDSMAQHLGVQYLKETRQDKPYVEPEAITVPNAITLGMLPRELLLEMRQAAMRLDQKQIEILLERVSVHDMVLSLGLETMVNDFRFDTIIQLCDVALGDCPRIE